MLFLAMRNEKFKEVVLQKIFDTGMLCELQISEKHGLGAKKQLKNKRWTSFWIRSTLSKKNAPNTGHF